MCVSNILRVLRPKQEVINANALLALLMVLTLSSCTSPYQNNIVSALYSQSKLQKKTCVEPCFDNDPIRLRIGG